jgi:NitT/TauT family transport system permease protein
MGELAPMWRIRLYQLLVLVAFFGGWEWISGRQIRTLWISKPSLIAERAVDWFSSGFIFSHILATLQIAGLGLLLGSAIGVAVGILLGLQRSLSRLLDPIISAAYTLPRVAFLPVLLVWFGFGVKPLVALVTLMIFFVLFYNARAGVESVDGDLVASMRVMGATRLQVIRMVILPSIVPFVLAAMMIAAPYALVGAIVGEIFIGNKGLGFLIVSSTGGLDLTGTFTACFVVTALALVATQVIARHGPRLLGRGPSSAPSGAGVAF